MPYELKLVFPAGQPRSERAASFAAVLQAHLAASPAAARGSLSSNDRAMSWQEDRDVFSLTAVEAAAEARRQILTPTNDAPRTGIISGRSGRTPAKTEREETP